MYIKEDITLDLLKNNGYDASSIPSFIQGILNTKYDFIIKEESTSRLNTINPQEFALLMYIFNSLITVENMEFDNTCYSISYGVDDTYHIPQPNGYDAILKYKLTSPVFIKSPSFMVNGIVHPETYDTKTVYLDLVYRLSGVTFNYDILLPFGEGIKNMFLEEKKQNVSSDKVINKLILSQFPRFTEYMESISGYLKELIPVSFLPTTIKNKKINTEVEFKSIVFNSMKEGVKIDKKEISEKYDNSLSEKYIKYLNQALEEVEPLMNNVLYAYPRITDSLIYPYNEDLNRERVKSLCRVAFNAEIYFQTLNRVMPENSKDGMLEISYKVKSAYYSLLKAFYFSYHMCFNKYYGELYYNPLIKEIKDDFIFTKSNVYYPVWTLNQCNSIRDRDTLLSLILKTVWHNNKFIMKKVEAPVRKLLSEKNNDMYIFKNLNSLYKKFTPQDTGFDKGQFRYNELLKTGLFTKLNTRDVKYLDFGGGIGDVGASIAKNVGFLKENSFVTDIQNWLGKEHTEEYAKYITYRYLKTNDLPFENESIDFITCLQVLHHIPDKKYTLSQLYRILKPGGIILVREHNCENIQDQMLIDLEHSLHGFVVDEQGQDYLQNYNDTYMNKLELSTMMIDSGFKNISDSVTFGEDKGITKYYYSLWIKVGKDEIINKIKSEGFPYTRNHMKPVDTYFSKLKNFKAQYSTDPQQLFKGFANFKVIKNTNDLYMFKEADKIPELNKKQSQVIILTKKEDYNIDIITNYFTEEARIEAKVCKGNVEVCLSPIEYWNKNLKNVINYVYSKGEELNNYTLREAMFVLCPEATLFKTTVAKTIYDIFKPRVIIDMSSGWGDRLIAAIAYSEDVKYFGYDPNTRLTKGYKNIIDTLAGDNGANFGVKTSPFETADLSYIKEDVDLVFTSPPYFDFEVYSEDKTQSIVQYPTFIDWCVNFLFRSLKNAFSKLRKDGYLVMHITDTKNMPNICELIMLYIEGYIGGSFIGTINTQAPGKKAIPMWVYKNTKNINETYKKNISEYYPEINAEINKGLIPQKKVEMFKKNWADYSDDED